MTSGPERLWDEYHRRDMLDAIKFAWEESQQPYKKNQFTINQSELGSWELRNHDPERGPLYVVSVVLTTGSIIQAEDQREILDSTKEMMSETFAANIHLVRIGPVEGALPRFREGRSW